VDVHAKSSATCIVIVKLGTDDYFSFKYMFIYLEGKYNSSKGY
jgi:hypothetical protein